MHKGKRKKQPRLIKRRKMEMIQVKTYMVRDQSIKVKVIQTLPKLKTSLILKISMRSEMVKNSSSEVDSIIQEDKVRWHLL